MWRASFDSAQDKLRSRPTTTSQLLFVRSSLLVDAEIGGKQRAVRRATRAGLGINSPEEVGDLFVERIIRVELFCCRINRKSDNPRI